MHGKCNKWYHICYYNPRKYKKAINNSCGSSNNKLVFNLNKAEFLIFLFTIILIIFAEMVNTAIETVVDLYVDVYHPKAKIAKDVAAGGVVITAINAIIVAYFCSLIK